MIIAHLQLTRTCCSSHGDLCACACSLQVRTGIWHVVFYKICDCLVVYFAQCTAVQHSSGYTLPHAQTSSVTIESVLEA